MYILIKGAGRECFVLEGRAEIKINATHKLGFLAS